MLLFTNYSRRVPSIGENYHLQAFLWQIVNKQAKKKKIQRMYPSLRQPPFFSLFQERKQQETPPSALNTALQVEAKHVVGGVDLFSSWE